MTPEQQEKVQAAATAAIDWSQAEHLKQEAELAKSFEEQGLKIYDARRRGVPRPRAEDVPRVRPREELARGPAREDQRARRLTRESAA